MRGFFTKVIVLIGTIFLIKTTTAQNQGKFHPEMFKISTDNDFLNYRLSGSDKYYTAGLEFGLFFKKTRKTISKNSRDQQRLSNLYYISLRQMMNTPVDISVEGFQQGDYPYAGLLFATIRKIHSESDSRFTNALSVGVLGPKAFAKETQTLVHKIIHYIKPKGWDSQIGDMVMFDFMARYEKGIPLNLKYLDLISTTELNVGTVFTNASTGFTLRIGKRLKNYFSNYEVMSLSESPAEQTKSFHFFINPSVSLIGFNATLQGNKLVNKEKVTTGKNEYRVSSDDIQRLMGRLVFGIKYETGNTAYSFSQTIQTREFSTVRHHEYGTLTVVFRL